MSIDLVLTYATAIINFIDQMTDTFINASPAGRVLMIAFFFVGIVMITRILKTFRIVFYVIFSPVILLYKIIRWSIKLRNALHARKLRKLKLENEAMRNKIFKSQIQQSQPAKQAKSKQNTRRTVPAAAR